MKKFVTLLVILLAALCVCVGCVDDSEPETAAIALADQLQTGYLMEQDLATQQRVFWRYYLYDASHGDNEGSQYFMHSNELRFLPEFAVDDTPDWEDVSRYLCDFAYRTKGLTRFGETEADYWNYDDMVAVRDVLLPTAQVERRSSGWLNYIADKDCYEAVGWDTNGAVYYLLREPIAEDDGVYTAKFAGYALGEMWYDEEENSGNYNDRVAYELWQHGGDDLSYFIDYVLPGELAAGNLTCCENVTVTFELSGDKELPLSYLGCEREELMSN